MPVRSLSHSLTRRSVHESGDFVAWLLAADPSPCDGKVLNEAERLAVLTAAEEASGETPGETPPRSPEHLARRQVQLVFCWTAPQPGSVDALVARRLRALLRHRAAVQRELKRGAATPALARHVTPTRAGEVVADESAPLTAVSSLYLALFAQLAAEGALESEVASGAVFRALAPALLAAPPLSLAGAPARAALAPLRAWLLRAAAADAGGAPRALLASLAAARGDLLDLLAVAPKLLHASDDSAVSLTTRRATAALRCAAPAAPAAHLTPCPDDASYLGSLPLPAATAGGEDGIAAMACGGKHLYVMHVGGMLRKVGTGLGGTRARQVIASVRLFHNGAVAPHACCLALHGDTLFARAPALSPAVFLAVHAPSMALLGRVMAAGASMPGDLLSCEGNGAWPHFCAAEASSSRHEDGAALDSAAALTVALSDSAPVVVSDGVQVHFVTLVAGRGSGSEGSFMVHSHDPRQRWRHSASLRLHASTLPGGRDSPSCLPAAALRHGTWFAGAGCLCVLLSPALASAARGRGALFMLRTFSLADGQALAECDAGLAPLRRCLLLRGSAGNSSCSEAVRLASFQGWPHMQHAFAHPARMAAAGFSFSPEVDRPPHPLRPPVAAAFESSSDRCLCFCCNLALISWLPEDEPWSEHRRHTPECAHAAGNHGSSNQRMATPRLATVWDVSSGVFWAAPACGAADAMPESGVSASAWRAPVADAPLQSSPPISHHSPVAQPFFLELLDAIDTHLQRSLPSTADRLAALLQLWSPGGKADVAARPPPASVFALQPDAESFGTLATLLEEEEARGEAGLLMPLLLRALTACLHAATVHDGGDAACFGLALSTAAGGPAATPPATRLRASLLRCCGSPQLAVLAANALCTGMDLLWPCGADQASLLGACCGADPSTPLPPSLTKQLLPRLARCALLPRFLADAKHPLAATLRGVLLSVLTGRTIRELCAVVPCRTAGATPAPPPTEAEPEAAHAAVSLLSSSAALGCSEERGEAVALHVAPLLAAATELLGAAAASLAAGASPAFIGATLRRSLLASLLPDALCEALASHPAAATLVPQLSLCAAALARLPPLPSEAAPTPAGSGAAAPAPPPPMRVSRAVVLQSAHPCDARADWERAVCVPGAAALRVTFDSRCSVERGAGGVSLYAGHGRRQPLGVRYTGGARSSAGAASCWPATAVHVSGDTLTLRFAAEGGTGREWGWRVSVEGLIPLPPPQNLPWLAGLARLLASCTGRAAAWLAAPQTLAADAPWRPASEALHALTAAMATSSASGAQAPADASTPTPSRVMQQLRRGDCDGGVLGKLRSLCGVPPRPGASRLVGIAEASFVAAALHAAGLIGSADMCVDTLKAQGARTLECGVDAALLAALATLWRAAAPFTAHFAQRRQALVAARGGAADDQLQELQQGLQDGLEAVLSLTKPTPSEAELLSPARVACVAAAVAKFMSAVAGVDKGLLHAARLAADSNAERRASGFAAAAAAAEALARGSGCGAGPLLGPLSATLLRTAAEPLAPPATRATHARLAVARTSLLTAALRLLPRSLEQCTATDSSEEPALAAMCLLDSLPLSADDVPLLRDAHAVDALCALARCCLGRAAPEGGAVMRVRDSAVATLRLFAATPALAALQRELAERCAATLEKMLADYQHAAKTASGPSATTFEAPLLAMTRLLRTCLTVSSCGAEAGAVADAALGAAQLAPPRLARPLLRLFAALHACICTEEATGEELRLTPRLAALLRLCGGATLAVCAADPTRHAPAASMPCWHPSPHIMLADAAPHEGRHAGAAAVAAAAAEAAVALRMLLQMGPTHAGRALVAACVAAAQQAGEHLRAHSAESAPADEDALPFAMAMLAVCGGTHASGFARAGAPALWMPTPQRAPFPPASLEAHGAAPTRCVVVSAPDAADAVQVAVLRSSVEEVEEKKGVKIAPGRIHVRDVPSDRLKALPACELSPHAAAAFAPAVAALAAALLETPATPEGDTTTAHLVSATALRALTALLSGPPGSSQAASEALMACDARLLTPIKRVAAQIMPPTLRFNAEELQARIVPARLAQLEIAMHGEVPALEAEVVAAAARVGNSPELAEAAPRRTMGASRSLLRVPVSGSTQADVADSVVLPRVRNESPSSLLSDGDEVSDGPANEEAEGVESDESEDSSAPVNQPGLGLAMSALPEPDGEPQEGPAWPFPTLSQLDADQEMDADAGELPSAVELVSRTGTPQTSRRAGYRLPALVSSQAGESAGETAEDVHAVDGIVASLLEDATPPTRVRRISAPGIARVPSPPSVARPLSAATDASQEELALYGTLSMGGPACGAVLDQGRCLHEHPALHWRKASRGGWPVLEQALVSQLRAGTSHVWVTGPGCGGHALFLGERAGRSLMRFTDSERGVSRVAWVGPEAFGRVTWHSAHRAGTPQSDEQDMLELDNMEAACSAHAALCARAVLSALVTAVDGEPPAQLAAAMGGVGAFCGALARHAVDHAPRYDIPSPEEESVDASPLAPWLRVAVRLVRTDGDSPSECTDAVEGFAADALAHAASVRWWPNGSIRLETPHPLGCQGGDALAPWRQGLQVRAPGAAALLLRFDDRSALEPPAGTLAVSWDAACTATAASCYGSSSRRSGGGGGGFQNLAMVGDSAWLRLHGDPASAALSDSWGVRLDAIPLGTRPSEGTPAPPLGAGILVAHALLDASLLMHHGARARVATAAASYALSRDAQPSGKPAALRLLARLLLLDARLLSPESAAALLCALQRQYSLEMDVNAPSGPCSAFLAALTETCVALRCGSPPAPHSCSLGLLPQQRGAACLVTPDGLSAHNRAATGHAGAALVRCSAAAAVRPGEAGYYEVTLRTGGKAHFGWCLSDAVLGGEMPPGEPSGHLGIDVDGWALDGAQSSPRFCARKAGAARTARFVRTLFTSSWKPGDVLGCGLRVVAEEGAPAGGAPACHVVFAFWLNGRALGEATEALELRPGCGFVPAASLGPRECASFAFARDALQKGAAPTGFSGTLSAATGGASAPEWLEAAAELRHVALALLASQPPPEAFASLARRAHPVPGAPDDAAHAAAPSGWCLAHDAALCHAATEASVSRLVDVARLCTEDVSEAALVPFGAAALASRLSLLRLLAARVAAALPLLDHSAPGQNQQLLRAEPQPPSPAGASLAACVSALRDALLPGATCAFAELLLQRSASAVERPSLSLNRARAAAVAAGSGGAARGARQGALFWQAHGALRACSPSSLRQPDRAWTVHLEGEGAQDLGGPYCESLSALCAELQSDSAATVVPAPAPLLVPTPNARTGVGARRDCWLPNPGAASAGALSRLRFLGALLGVALRTGVALDLQLPPLLWRALAGAPLRECDWAEVDALHSDALCRLEQAPEDAPPEERAQLLPLCGWTFPRLDGATLALPQAPAEEEDVSWAQRHAYVAAASAARQEQLAPQLAALACGVACIVPAALLRLLSPRQLARRCCGSSDVDVAALRAASTVSGCSADEPHLGYFWTALADFTPAQRRAFLRFACGRSRLPPGHVSVAGRGLELQPLLRTAGSPDAYLPVAHTCFFSLELPRYSSLEVTRARLMYAVSEGVAIDTDHAVRDARAWRDLPAATMRETLTGRETDLA